VINFVSIKGQIIKFIWKMDRFIVKRTRRIVIVHAMYHLSVVVLTAIYGNLAGRTVV